jgi:acyl-CoA thioesterase
MSIDNVVGNDKFAKHVGIKLLDISKGSARAEMEITDQHLNGLDMVHGAAIFTLADLAFAAAANSHDVDAVAINVTITYFKATRKGKLFAEAREISLNRKLSTYLIEVTDDAGDKVAAFQGTAYRKNAKNQQ